MTDAPYIQLRNGERYEFHSARALPLSIRIEDIAFALAHINRFTGHVGAYSVAEHSVHVMHEAMRHAPGNVAVARAALMHDAHEVLVGDVASPLKRALYRDWRSVENCAVAATERRFGLRRDPEIAAIVHAADQAVTCAEARHFLGKAATWATAPAIPGWRPWGPIRRWRRAEIFVYECTKLGIT